MRTLVTRFRPHLWYFASLTVLIVAFAFRLDGYPLLDPDEGRNAEIAREMAATNDYILPRLNGLPYVDKPVLYFAATAAAMEVFGPTVFAARLPSLLFTLATLVVVAWFGRRLFGPTGGWIAAIATAAAPLTLAFARTVIFDSALTLLVVAAVVAIYEAAERHRDSAALAPNEHRSETWWPVAAWGALALGVLTKGPIALALPLMIAIPYLAWQRRWRALGDPLGIALFVAILLPWILAISQRVPDFLEYAVVTETYKRLTTDELQRSGPIWYFLPILVAGALPWSLIAIAGWKSGPGIRELTGRWDRRVVFLLLWVLVPLAFFSLSQSKRPQYVLPLIPAVGLIVAFLWTARPNRLPGARVASLALAVLGGVILSAPIVVPALLDVHPAVDAAIPSTSIGLGGVTIAAATGAWIAVNRPPLIVFLLSLPVATIPLVSTRLMDAIGEDRSAAALAAAIEAVADQNTDVIAVQTYPLSLPFYLQRPLILSTSDGSELTSNYLPLDIDHWRDQPGSPLRSAAWWREALLNCNQPRIFLARAGADSVRVTLAARLPLLAASRKVTAYGPCGVTDLASSSVWANGYTEQTAHVVGMINGDLIPTAQ